MTVSTQTEDHIDDQVDTVLQASRSLIRVVDQSLAEVDGILSLLQFRALLIVEGAGQSNLREVAARLDVHPSNASRLLDRLVNLKLVTRAEATHDRRHLTLSLTEQGQRLVDRVMTHRRKAIQAAMLQMEPALRASLAVALEAFSSAASADAH